MGATLCERPAFRVPTMTDVRASARNGLTVASTFSGCGGSALGYTLAGFRVAYANEFIPIARETYLANFPTTFVDDRDVRLVKGADILARVGLARGELDVLDGSPPCAAFSKASNKRTAGWGQERPYSETRQRVDDLFFEYARLVEEIRPRVFVAENVAGLLRGVSHGFFNDVYRALEAPGYRVRAQVLDAQYLGVPQRRQRVIFIGVRDDLDRDPVFPGPLPYRYSVRDVCPWIRCVKRTGHLDHWAIADRPAETLTVTAAVQPIHWYFSASWIEATLDDGRAEIRRYTIDEVKRLSTFPEDFVLLGTFEQQWERIARAVPPLMMRAIATTIAESLFDVPHA